MLLAGCKNEEQNFYRITERDPENTTRLKDNPETTNDESNDQKLGEYGTVTICAHYINSGNRYPLDADIFDGKLTTLYFEKGGNLDFIDCEIDEDYLGSCIDQSGRQWEFEGKC